MFGVGKKLFTLVKFVMVIVWELRLRNKDGKAKVVNGHEEYPHNFNKLIKALNNLFGSKVESIKI